MYILKNYIFTVLLLVIIDIIHSTNTFGQHKILGIVESTTKDKLEYVNIGIPLKNIGTVSDHNGSFSIEIPHKNINDTIIFSIIGYTKKLISVRNLIEADNNVVVLHEIDYNIEEIKIIADKYKSKKFGNDFRNPSYIAGFDFDMLGYEVGVLMNNKKNGIVENIGVNIAECEYDTLLMRLNIYDFNNGEISNQLLKKPYYIKISNDSIKALNGILNFSLRDFNLKVSGKFFVSIEMIVDYPGKEGLGFYDGMLSTSTTYTRFTSHAKWEKAPFNVGINSTVIYEK